MRASSLGSGATGSNCSRAFDLLGNDDGAECGDVGGAMLPVFLNDLRMRQSTIAAATASATNNQQELVEVELEVDENNIVVCSVGQTVSDEERGGGVVAAGRFSTASSMLRQKFACLRSESSRTSSELERPAISALEALRIKSQIQRIKLSAQKALDGLRFINKTTDTSDATHLWKLVEARFESLAKDGLLCRDDFGECIGMVDSKEFAVGIFDALARRKRQRIGTLTKEELYDFWLQLSDQSFDARLQIFFDMADRNVDGRITKKEVQELWQLEMLLLQKDVHMEYSRSLSTASIGGWSQNLNSFRPTSAIRRLSCKLKYLILENWQRCWVIMLWLMVMVSLFLWKFYQYRNRAAFEVMGYCLCTAKGAAETVKLNMALILLPVCRNTLTWLRSTGVRLFVPFDDNINFHKMIACALVFGIILHSGNHLACDFHRLANASPEKFASVASDFNNKKPTYWDLLTGIEGLTGISMIIIMAISFTLATRHFQRNVVRLPAPFNCLAGYNAFWYSHHLLALVYVLLLIHGTFLLFVHQWNQKTTWMYISVPLMLYVAERSLRTCRSKYYAVKILKVSELPGNVFAIIMSKPQAFKYRSGQYIFLQCPMISKFQWHPFSVTSAPGDNYLSIHIRIVGDWTQELKQVLTEGTGSTIGRLNCNELDSIDQRGLPKLLVDGPYGAPAQDYQNYDVLLLVGLGIGATPFISILRDLLNSKRAEERMDSVTDISTSGESLTSFASSISTAQAGKRKAMRIKSAHFYWVTREPGSFEWFKGAMDEVAEMDQKGLIEMHNYLTSVYEEGDARSALITMIQSLSRAKYGVDVFSGTRVKTHFARPNWKEVFTKIAKKHPYGTVGVFYCGRPVLAKELKKLSYEMSQKSPTRFEFHKEQFGT